jgi:hypothetical protein
MTAAVGAATFRHVLPSPTLSGADEGLWWHGFASVDEVVDMLSHTDSHRRDTPGSIPTARTSVVRTAARITFMTPRDIQQSVRQKKWQESRLWRRVRREKRVLKFSPSAEKFSVLEWRVLFVLAQNVPWPHRSLGEGGTPDPTYVFGKV